MVQIVCSNVEKHSVNMMAELSRMRQEKDHCDFVIQVGNDVYYAHKNVLSAGSDYFKALLKHDTKESHEGKVVFRDVDFECVKSCLDFIYSGKFAITDEKLNDLLHVAIMMQLEEVKQIISDILEESITVENYFSSRNVADMYGLDAVLSRCRVFFHANIMEISNQPEFGNIAKIDILNFVKSEKSELCEDELLTLLLNWVEKNQQNERHLQESLEAINFDKISPAFLEHLLESNSIVNNNLRLYKLLNGYLVKALKRLVKTKEEIINDRLIIFLDDDRCTDDVELKTTANAWKPKRSQEELDTLFIMRDVSVILNKVTPSTFNDLMQQVLALKIDTERKLRGTVDLIFEKALDNPSFSEVYANMCRQMMHIRVTSEESSDQQNPEGQVEFRKLVLTKCQKEFERDQSEREHLLELKKKMEANTDQELAPQLKEEYDTAELEDRRRTLANIRFIGELFKLRMLTEPIMHNIIMTLFNAHDDDHLESLCHLLTLIGKDLDHPKAKPRLDQYFSHIGKIIDEKRTSSRVRFMLQDVNDLRANNWVPRAIHTQGPKTISQIHQDAKNEQEMLQLMRVSTPNPVQKQPRHTAPPSSSPLHQQQLYQPAKLKTYKWPAVSSTPSMMGKTMLTKDTTTLSPKGVCGNMVVPYGNIGFSAIAPPTQQRRADKFNPMQQSQFTQKMLQYPVGKGTASQEVAMKINQFQQQFMMGQTPNYGIQPQPGARYFLQQGSAGVKTFQAVDQAERAKRMNQYRHNQQLTSQTPQAISPSIPENTHAYTPHVRNVLTLGLVQIAKPPPPHAAPAIEASVGHTPEPPLVTSETVDKGPALPDPDQSKVPDMASQAAKAPAATHD